MGDILYKVSPYFQLAGIFSKPMLRQINCFRKLPVSIQNTASSIVINSKMFTKGFDGTINIACSDIYYWHSKNMCCATI